MKTALFRRPKSSKLTLFWNFCHCEPKRAGLAFQQSQVLDLTRRLPRRDAPRNDIYNLPGRDAPRNDIYNLPGRDAPRYDIYNLPGRDAPR